MGLSQNQAEAMADRFEDLIKEALASSVVSKIERENKEIKEFHTEIKAENKSIKSILEDITKSLNKLEIRILGLRHDMESQNTSLRHDFNMIKNNLKFYSLAIIVAIPLFEKAYPQIVNFIFRLIGK